MKGRREARARVLRAGAEAVAGTECAHEAGPQQQGAMVVDDRVAQVERDRVGAVAGAQCIEPRADESERFVPADRLELSVRRFSQRRAQPVGIVMHVANRHALGADEAAREHVLFVAAHRDDAVALDLKRKPATRLAKRAAAEDRAAPTRHALASARFSLGSISRCLDARASPNLCVRGLANALRKRSPRRPDFSRE